MAPPVARLGVALAALLMFALPSSATLISDNNKVMSRAKVRKFNAHRVVYGVHVILEQKRFL